MKIEELIEKINSAKITQNDDWEDQCFGDDINEALSKGEYCDTIEEDEHRWYATGVNVVRFEDGLIGIKTIIRNYQECGDYSDCRHTITAHKVGERISIAYYTIDS